MKVKICSLLSWISQIKGGITGIAISILVASIVNAETLADGYNYTEKVGDYTWSFSIIDGKAEIGFRNSNGNEQGGRAVQPSPSGALIVPDTLGGCPVTRIGKRALYDCGMSSVQLPASLADIGERALQWCYSLSQVVIPASVTNIGNYAFQSCRLGGIELNEGLKAIGYGAFEGNSSLRYAIIPSTVERIESYVFSSCSQLTVVFFKGNAPQYVNNYFYNGASSELVTFVRDGSTGWSSAGSSELPEIWPSSGASRDIRVWTTYPYLSWLVKFDLGEHATRIGGGDLEQTIYDYSAAAEPLLSLAPGYTLDSWSKDFSCITNSMTVSAIYRKDGKLLDGYNYTEKVGDYTWTFSIIDGKAEIGLRDSSGNEQWGRAVQPSPSGALIVPDTLGGCPVTRLGYCALYNCYSMSSVQLPASLVDIGNCALQSCYNLSQVDIPAGVKNIGNQAFCACYNITIITIPAAVMNIGNHAFGDCDSITTITIPAAVTNIGDSAFRACSNLRNLSVDAENAYYSSDDGVLYNKDKSDLHYWPRAKKIELPTTLKNIRSYACCDNYATTGATLVFPSAVTNIGNYAFQSCQLGGIELNEGLKSIGYGAFQYNSSLRYAIIPSTVERIESAVFYNCSQLTAVFFKGNAPQYVNSYFYNETSSELVTFVRDGSTGWSSAGSRELPETWPSSGASRDIRVWTTYPYPSWLVKFDLGEHATRIGGGDLEQTIYDYSAAAAPLLSLAPGYTFDSWSKDFSCITNSMTVSAIYRKDGKLLDGYNYTEKVGDYTWTFSIIDGKAEIGLRDSSGNEQWGRAVQPSPSGALTVPDTLGGCPVTRLGYCALYNCGMSSVQLPASLVDIGNYALQSCYNLSQVDIPAGVKNIGYEAFWNCKITTITIPAAVTNIGDSAFCACYNLRNLSVDAENAYYSSDDGVLYNKDKSDLHYWPRAKKIELPTTLKNIRPYACCNNYATTGATLAFPSAVTNIGNYAFQSCQLGGIELNDGLKSIGNYAFQSCQLGGIELNDGLKSIGYGAFQYNSSLRYAIIPSTVERIESYVFSSCSQLTAVFFKGNAPQYVNNSFYYGTSSELVTFVRAGSTGWSSAESSELPEIWPATDEWGNGTSRDIRVWTTYPYLSWLVKFDLGEHATRIGGGDLEQQVIEGMTAVAPTLSVRSDWDFCGWDADFDCITASKTVRAIYVEKGTQLLTNIKTEMEPAWSQSIVVEYDGPSGNAGADKLARLYYLVGDAWQRVPTSRITGDFSLTTGHHRIVVDIDGLDLEYGDAAFKITVAESVKDGIEVVNDDGWTEESGTWRSRAIGHSKTTSLYAIVDGISEFEFTWWTSSEGYCDRLTWYVDDEEGGQISGETDCTDVVVELPDDGEHEIRWTYSKDGSAVCGQDCGWVEIDGAASSVVGNTPFTVTIPEPTMELAAEYRDEDTVELVSEVDGATIYYTLDGSMPTTSSSIYTQPVAWTDFKRMKVVAVAKTGEWSEVLDGSQCVRVMFNAANGWTDATSLIRRIGEPYGELPEAWRDGCDFNGWTRNSSDLRGEYGYYIVDEDDEVPSSWSDKQTLYATWDMSVEDVLNPGNTLDDIEINASNYYLRRACYDCDKCGLEEYVEFEGDVDENSETALITVYFSGVGTLEVERFRKYCDSGVQVYWRVDGEDCALVNNRLKVLTNGDHILEIGIRNDSDYDRWFDIYIGGMYWEPAPDSVVVDFDANGFGVSPSATREYNTGATYGVLPMVEERNGYEFVGWFTDSVSGDQVDGDEYVDFEVTKLYARWKTSLAAALNVSGGTLTFDSSGAEGWTGLTGCSHDGIAAAASGWLDWDETNTLSTTVSGKGVFSFWWRIPVDYEEVETRAWLTIDGKQMPLDQIWLDQAEYEQDFDGWLHFTISLTSGGQHQITWSSTLEDVDYWQDDTDLEQHWKDGMLGMWIDEVKWVANVDQTDVVEWAHSSVQAWCNLPGLAQPMINAYSERIRTNDKDYDAYIRRAIARFKQLTESQVLRELLKDCGYEFSDDWTAIMGAFNSATIPETNEAVDELANEIVPVLESMLADLEVVPMTWSGTVALKAQDYPVDEDVYVDAADVVMVKAMIRGWLVVIKSAQGYDLTLDNRKLEEEIVANTNRHPIVVSPLVGNDWSSHACSRMTGTNKVGFVRVASEGMKLKIDLELPTDMPDIDQNRIVLNGGLRLKMDEAEKSGEEIAPNYLDIWFYPTDDGYIARVYATRYFEDWGERFGATYTTLSERKGNHLYLTLDLDEVEVDYNVWSRGGCICCGDDSEDDLEAIPINSLNGLELHEVELEWYNYETEEAIIDFESDGEEYEPNLTLEALLAAHPKFAANIRNLGKLAEAKTECAKALDLYGVFDNLFRARTDNVLHFFEYDEEDGEIWDEIASRVKLAQKSLNEIVTVALKDVVRFCDIHEEDEDEEIRMTLKPFFDGKILRSLLPTISGDLPVLSSIPDITFAGTFPDWTMENRMPWLRQICGIWGEVSPTPDPTPDPDPTPNPTPDPDPTPDPTPDPEPAHKVVEEVIGAPAVEKAAATYDGYIVDGDGNIKGTVSVKAAKAKTDKKSGKTTSKLTITVQLTESTKKVSIAGDYDLTAGGEQTFSKNGQSITLKLGENGMTGRYGDYEIEGVPNVFAAKDTSSKTAASAAEAAYVGTYNLKADEGVFTIAVAKKGKVKISGTTAEGKKVSATAQLLVGDSAACVPVVVPKLGLSFVVWFEDGNAKLSVQGMGNATIGQAGTLTSGAAFRLDAEELARVVNDSTYSQYFPAEVAVSQNGNKWIVAPDASGKAAKAGKVVLKNGVVDETKLGKNPSALKLTYTAKTGSFKGSFKVYIAVKGKLKALSATVTGVMINGIGYGTATIKKYGSVEVVVH